MENEIKQTIELSFKLNPKDIGEYEDVQKVINDFISKDNIVSINIDTYFEDYYYKYFMVIAIFDDDKNLSKITKLKKEAK